MAAKKTAKKKTAKKKTAAKKAPVKKEIDPAIMGKCIVMVRRGQSKEAVSELMQSAEISEAKAMKVVFAMQTA